MEFLEEAAMQFLIQVLLNSCQSQSLATACFESCLASVYLPQPVPLPNFGPFVWNLLLGFYQVFDVLLSIPYQILEMSLIAYDTQPILTFTR